MTFVTPLAAVSGSLPILLGARVLLGIGEGVGTSYLPAGYFVFAAHS